MDWKLIGFQLSKRHAFDSDPIWIFNARYDVHVKVRLGLFDITPEN